MFETDAEEYANRNVKQSKTEEKKFCRIDWQKGAEFGYYKALKETWHYTSKGDFPKTEGSYYVAMDNGRGYKSGAILNWVEETDCEEDFHWEDDDYECYDEQVYAWKECPILPPKEID